MKIGFAGPFSVRLADRVRRHLDVECETIVADEAGMVGRLPEVDVLVTLAFTREMAAKAPRLKLVQVPGAGLDRIDRSALPADTMLANAYNHEAGIAEYVMGAMLSLSRGFCRIDGALRRGRWESPWVPGAEPPPTWPELAGKTLGILGYGRIGQQLARRARGFEMTIWAMRQRVTREAAHGVAFLGGPEALDEILKRADYLAVTLPLTDVTRGLLGAREFGLMKPTALLVNIARALIVDEDALYEALRRGTIAGAALDVWYRYPAGDEPTFPSRRPFHELPNVLMTPHVSGWTEGTMEGRARLVAENIGRVARGEAVANLVPRNA
jgi:phosphoglycerate dehydrogenase-like enzyme